MMGTDKSLYLQFAEVTVQGYFLRLFFFWKRRKQCFKRLLQEIYSICITGLVNARSLAAEAQEIIPLVT